jgi:peptide/nickel transport system permease protein
MDWWKQLKRNTLARIGAMILLVFYLMVIAAEFVAPYSPYDSQPDGALLPPTKVYWVNQATKKFIGPHVYPTVQGAIDLNTGKRDLKEDFAKPSPLRLFVKGTPYRIGEFQPLKVGPLGPVKTKIPVFNKEIALSLPELTLIPGIPGIPGNIHLFGSTPGFFNLLGTDEQARDQFSRLVYGGRISLSIGLVGIAISFPLGLFIGGIAGYFGGWTDTILMRIVEVLMTIPGIYLLIALASVLPAGISSSQRFLLITLITSFINWASLARVIRGQVLSIKEREYVQAAKVMGAKPIYIIVRHILPQTATYIIISATLTIPSFIVAESVLSLIGLGIQQPDPSWGNMLSLATNASILVLQPWLIWAPASVIVLTVLAFNLVGDGLRDVLDPRSLER